MLNSQGFGRTLSWPILRHRCDIRQYKTKKQDGLSSDINCSITPFLSWYCTSGCSVNRAIPFSADVRAVWIFSSLCTACILFRYNALINGLCLTGPLWLHRAPHSFNATPDTARPCDSDCSTSHHSTTELWIVYDQCFRKQETQDSQQIPLNGSEWVIKVWATECLQCHAADRWRIYTKLG